MPTLSDRRSRAGWFPSGIIVLLTLGCGGEPSDREIQNARAFEALLTAVSLHNAKEVEADARLIVGRHDEGSLSDANYRVLAQIIDQARAGDWAGAEKRAYEFRSGFGDGGAYFR